MIPALFKINVLSVYSLRNELPGPWGLYNYICILEKPLCHLNSSNSVAFAGITDFSGRDIGKHCSKDAPLLTQLPLYQRLSWVIPTLQSLGLRLPGGHGLKFVMQPGIPTLSDLSGWNLVTSWLSGSDFTIIAATSTAERAKPSIQHETDLEKIKIHWAGILQHHMARAASHLFFPLEQEGRMVTMLKDQQLSPSHPIHMVEHPLCGCCHQEQCLALFILFILNQSSRETTQHIPSEPKYNFSLLFCASLDQNCIISCQKSMHNQIREWK